MQSKGNFPFKKFDSKPINLARSIELLCLPCPDKMVSSLNRNACSFCKAIPRTYLNDDRRSTDHHQPTSPNSAIEVSNDECTECDENEILVERPLNQLELVNLNQSALIANYNYSREFNQTHFDQLLVRQCIRCPSQTRSINNQCRACHFSFENCSCSPEKGLVISNGVCITRFQLLNFNKELFKINYTDQQTVVDDDDAKSADDKDAQYRISPFIATNFHSSFSQCKYYHNISACEQFANLCVLNHYRFKPKTSSQSISGKVSSDLTTICDVYMELNKQMPVNYLPQLYFTKDESTKDFLFKTSTKIEFKLNERLRFYVVAFNANGRFKESRELYLDELLICSSKDRSMDAIGRFAVNVEFKCMVQLNRLFAYTPTVGEEQLFYELYLLLNQTSLNQTKPNPIRTLYPIYVLNRNLLRDDRLVNREGFTLDYFNYYMDHSNYFSEMINQWQLVKRFFMVEQVSSKEAESSKTNLATSQGDRSYGRTDGQTTGDQATGEYGVILRYASKMKLMIRTVPENPNQIYPPLLVLEYGQVTRKQFEKQPDRIVQIELDVQFESSEFSLYRKLTIFLAIFCSLTVLLGLFRTWSWSKRSNHDNTLNLAILFKFILFNCDYLANVFFVLVLLISINSFLIYKFQSVVYCFLPSKSLEHYTQLYIIIAFSLKSISILHDFWVRSYIDIFFIDWEKSRSGRLGSSSASKLNSNSTNNLNNFTNQTKSHEPINSSLQETDNHLYKYLNQHTLNGNAGGNQSGWSHWHAYIINLLVCVTFVCYVLQLLSFVTKITC